MYTTLREAWFFSRTHLLPLTQIALLYTLPSIATELYLSQADEPLSNHGRMLISGLLIALGILQFAAALVYIDRRVKSVPVTPLQAISHAASLLAPLLLINLLTGLLVGGGLMLLVLPGLFLAYKLLFAEFLLLFHQRSPIEALRESYRISEGLFAQIAPPMLLWMSAVLGLSVLRATSGDETGTLSLGNLLSLEAATLLVTLYGWALLYRLYQRHIEPRIQPPNTESQGRHSP